MTAQTVRSLKLAVLAAMARDEWRSVHKVNLIGRPSQPGQLEHFLSCEFDSATRSVAYRALEQLQRDGLVEPTFADTAAPEAWLVLTDRGRLALQRRALDPLDEALHSIDPHLVEVRAGAWSAAASSEPDALRQAAHSARELIEQALKTSASDEQVKASPWFKPEASGRPPTRRHRLQFIMERYRHTISENELRIAEKACDLVLAIDKRLQAMSHAREALVRSDVEDAMLAAEIALRRVLLGASGDG